MHKLHLPACTTGSGTFSTNNYKKLILIPSGTYANWKKEPIGLHTVTMMYWFSENHKSESLGHYMAFNNIRWLSSEMRIMN